MSHPKNLSRKEKKTLDNQYARIEGALADGIIALAAWERTKDDADKEKLLRCWTQFVNAADDEAFFKRTLINTDFHSEYRMRKEVSDLEYAVEEIDCHEYEASR